jgi:hypothetical protein
MRFGARRTAACWPGLLGLLCGASGLAGPCTELPGAYETQQYAVESIRLSGPLRHFRAIRDEALKASLPQRTRLLNPDGTVREPGTFNTNAWSLGTLALRNQLTDPGVLQRFEIVVVTAGLENCNPETKTLDIVYTVFAFGVPATVNFGRTTAAELVVRTLLHNGPARFLSLFPQPLVGYNKSRGWFGGTQVTSAVQPGGFFDTASMHATGSGNSVETGLEMQGSRSRDRGAFREREWGLNYQYFNLPSDLEGIMPEAATPDLREGMVSGRFAVSTKPLAGGNAVLRFGGAIGGGATQSSASEALALFSSNSVGRLSLYAGSILQAGPYYGRLSYGVRRTQQGSELANGFFRHTVDTRHEFRFLPAPHRPLSIEVDLGGGLLPRNKTLPVGEAFFGGNVPRAFIPGDSWEIRSDPYFRSLPQLSLRPGGSLFGATRYVAFNSTIAPTVWGRPLLPKEILSDATFRNALTGQLNSAETLLSSDYIVKSPLLGSMRNAVAALEPRMAELRQKLEELKTQIPESGEDELEEVLSALDDVDDGIETAQEDPAEQTSPTLAYRTLAKGFGEGSPSALDALAESLRKLKDAAPVSASSWLESEAAIAEKAGQSLSIQLDEVEESALASAGREMVFARRLVDRLLNEVNVASVAPLLVFDAVRVAPEPESLRRWRFGAGPGLRLSLVNVNLSVGYAFNLNRRAGDPRGAFLIEFSVTDLFR